MQKHHRWSGFNSLIFCFLGLSVISPSVNKTSMRQWMNRRGEERRGEERREGEKRGEERGGEERRGLGPREENESKVNMKDKTGTRDRAEFRSRGEGGERKSGTEQVDGKINKSEKDIIKSGWIGHWGMDKQMGIHEVRQKRLRLS